MSDYTAAEILEVVQQLEEDDEWDSWSEFGYGPYDRETHTHAPEFITLRGERVEVRVVFSDTGGEGHGENVSIVFGIGDQLFEVSGYYASHYGTDWDDDSLIEVVEAEQVITVYNPK